MGLGSIEDGSNATMVLPNAHMGPSGAEALTRLRLRGLAQCPLTPNHPSALTQKIYLSPSTPTKIIGR